MLEVLTLPLLASLLLSSFSPALFVAAFSLRTLPCLLLLGDAAVEASNMVECLLRFSLAIDEGGLPRVFLLTVPNRVLLDRHWHGGEDIRLLWLSVVPAAFHCAEGFLQAVPFRILPRIRLHLLPHPSRACRTPVLLQL
jgi:hypothetical protein